MGAYDKYLKWANEHKDWVAALKVLRNCPYGFSFTEKLPAPELKEIYRDGTSYVAVTRCAEFAEEDAWYKGEYQDLWRTYQAGFGEYLAIGEIFLRDITNPAMTLRQKHDLMVEVQSEDFLMHNAAVLRLEHKPAPDLGAGQDYEEVLKALYADTLRDGHPEWFGGRPTARQLSLLRYLLGRTDQDVIPLWNDPRLDAVRAASHVTLGKVILKGEVLTGRWMHPCYWGLFLMSPLRNDDRGFYQPGPGDQDHNWVNYLSGTLHLPDQLFRHAAAGFQAYEILPRPYGNPAYVSPGIYLHRSQAHGRDDFLTLIPEPGQQPQVPLVFCTKGVGSDPDLIGSATAREFAFVKGFGRRFATATNTQFPFAYPALDNEEAKRAGSWRNIGFCTTYAGDEVSIVDFSNFATMYSRAALHTLTRNGHGFVQPVSLIEINCLDRSRARMKELLPGIDGKLIGYPVQVVTASPVETSLRISKDGSKQDYILGNLGLELAEWERCYAGVALPASVLQAVDRDLAFLERQIRQHVADAKISWTDAVGYPEADLAARFDSLRRRMVLAFKMIYRAFASWKVFLDYSWASDTYTGSFSGRNFNSGPRDSNDWGPLDRPTETQELDGRSAGEGFLCVHIDVANLSMLLGPGGDVYKMLELLAGRGPASEEEGGVYYAGRCMWEGSTLAQFATAIAQVCGTVRNQTLGGPGGTLWSDAQKQTTPQRRRDYIAAKVNEAFKVAVVAKKNSLLTDLLPWWS